MRIQCTTCGATVPVGDVSLDRMLAKCRPCDSVFDISSMVDGSSPPPPVLQPTAPIIERRRIPMPAGIRILVDDEPIESRGDYRQQPVRKDGTLVIERRWFNATYHPVLAFFCVFGAAFYSLWYRPAFDDHGLAGLIVPIAHLSAEIALVYVTVAGFLNRTCVGGRGGELFIEHGPLPWRGNRRLPTSRLRQLFADEIITRSKSGNHSRHRLGAVLDDGSRVMLISNLTNGEQAVFLEKTIEERLGIEDVRVAANELG